MSNTALEPLSEEQVRQIMARAAELDARDVAPGLNDVRAAALEAGIAPHAIERAIAEAHRLAEHTEEPQPAARATHWWKRPVAAAALFAAGVILGICVNGIDPRGLGSESSSVLMLVSGGFAAIRALEHRRRVSLSAFHTELALLLGGSTFVLAAVQGGESVQASLLWWAICAATGTAVVRLRRKSGTSQVPA
ncbi:MAG TPA: hypothetical protein VK912_20190 [Longimicrobiales bacterium]|nr:hypothetical protein [Longimicrobiales bacterium]